MRYLYRSVFAFLTISSVIWHTCGERPVRLLDSGDQPIYPGCSASYALQCSFNSVHRLVDTVGNELRDSANVSAVLEAINDGERNLADTSGFVPYVLETSGMTCLANGRNTSYNGATMATIAEQLSIATLQDDLDDLIFDAAQESADGWFSFIFTSVDLPSSPIAHHGYALQVNTTEGSYIVLASFAKRQLPREISDVCTVEVNRLCAITNARSFIGAALSRAFDIKDQEQLTQFLNEISYPIDTTFAEGEWEMDAWEVDAPRRLLATLNHFLIGLTHYQLTYLFDQDKSNGTAMHLEMRKVVLEGGGWSGYNFVDSEGNEVHKITLISGFQLFDVNYLIGVGFTHSRDDVAEAALCELCSARTNAPCSIYNTMTLLAHAHVELLRIASFESILENLRTKSEFYMDGGFGVALIDYDQNVVIDTLNSTNGSICSIEDSFAARHVRTTLINQTHSLLIEAANAGVDWIALPGTEGYADFIVLVSKIIRDERSFYLFGGFANEQAETKMPCSAEYDDACSDNNVRALVGNLATDMLLARSEDDLQAIFDEINQGGGFEATYQVNPNFYPIVLDEDFNMVAYGDKETRGDWNMDDPSSFLAFVNQELSISSLGEEFLSEIRNAALQVGGGYVNSTWINAVEGTTEVRNIFCFAVRFQTSTGAYKAYFVLSMFIKNPEAPVCMMGGDSDCPSNAYCVSGDHGIKRCECSFYYDSSYEVVDTNTCSESLTRNTSMSCFVDESKSGIKTVKLIGFGLSIINYSLAGICIIWTFIMRRHAIVKASQPQLLVLVAIGTLVSTTAIIYLITDDSEGQRAGDGLNEAANWACMAQPWFYGLGFAITYCSMIVKLQRISRVFKSAAQMKRKVKGVSLKITLVYLIALLAVEASVLIAWTALDPLKFVRPDEDPINGSCQSDLASNFVITIAVYHLALLIYGAYLSYKCRKVNGVFAESKYLSLAMISNLQVLLLALPVTVLTADDTETSMFIRSIAVFLNDFSTTSLIFLPKMYFCIYGPPESSGIGTNVIGKRNKAYTTTSQVSTAEAGPSTVHPTNSSIVVSSYHSAK